MMILSKLMRRSIPATAADHGPLINFKGEVIGININTIIRGERIGFAVPINMVKEVLIELREKGKMIRGWLGMSVQELTSNLVRQFGLKSERGAVVSAVVAGGPAEKAGLQKGDVITEFNGKSINNYRELPSLMRSLSLGEKVLLRVLRDEREQIISITAGTLE